MTADDTVRITRERLAQLERAEEALRYVAGERDRRGAAIERVRNLCADVMVEDVKGGLTNADSLWPTDVLAALDGARG